MRGPVSRVETCVWSEGEDGDEEGLAHRVLTGEVGVDDRGYVGMCLPDVDETNAGVMNYDYCVWHICWRH